MKLWQHRSPLAFSLIADAVRSWNIRQGCLMSNSTSWMTRPIFSFYTCIFFLSLYSISSYFTSFFLPFFFLFWLLWGEFRFLYIGIGDDEDQATEFAQLLGSLFVFFLPVSLSLCLSFFLSLSLSLSLSFSWFCSEKNWLFQFRVSGPEGKGAQHLLFPLECFPTVVIVVWNVNISFLSQLPNRHHLHWILITVDLHCIYSNPS